MSQIAGKCNEADTSSKNLCEEHRQRAWCSIRLNGWVAQRKVTGQKHSDFEKRLVPRPCLSGWRSPSSWKLSFRHVFQLPQHRITESQNGRGWKGPLWVIWSNPPAEAGSPTAGCTGSCPGGSWISPEKETPQPPRAASSSAPSPSEGRRSSSCSDGKSK